jgi:hypothetical protein
VVRLFSCTVHKSEVQITVSLGNEMATCNEVYGQILDTHTIPRPPAPSVVSSGDGLSEQTMVTVPLIDLAWGRSGDKGNKANIGIIARRVEYLPYIYAAMTEDTVRARFAHFLADNSPTSVGRYLLPGTNAINFLLHDVLGGGGVASLRNDPQGKGYAQLLLCCPIPVPATIAESLS